MTTVDDATTTGAGTTTGTTTGASSAMSTGTLPRLIASDLDGTFLSPDGTVSTTNAAAVRLAAERGIPMVFATGRPIRWLQPISVLDGLHPMVVASNGAMLYDVAADEIVEQVAIEPTVAIDVTTRVRKLVPDAAFAVEQGRGFGYERGYEIWDDARADPAVFTGPIAELVAAGPFVKLLVKCASMPSDELAAVIADDVGDQLTITHSAFGDTGLLEISAPGVSKASMLAGYCGRLGIDAAEVAAFGDMPNDLEMLTWAGRPYVMTNAHPLLRRIGATAAGDNAESGVGRTILALLGGEPARTQ